LNKKAESIKKFFNILKKAYECRLTKAKKPVIKCDIDDAKLRDFVKYLEDLDFTKYTDNDFTLLGKLLQIFKINGANEDFDDLVTKLNNSKPSLYEVIKSSIRLTYAHDLFNTDSEWKLLIVKDKYRGNLYFTIMLKDDNFDYKNEGYDVINLCIHEVGYIGLLKQSKDKKYEIDDIRMNLALNLSSNLLRDFKMCLTYDALTILNHVSDNVNPLPKVEAKLPFYSEAKEKDIQGTYSYVWTNRYLYNFSKTNVDADKLYIFQNILKIEVDENYKIKYSFEKGKKQMNVDFTNIPFEISTVEKMVPVLGKLKDFTKIDEVQNDLLKLVKEDKIYSKQNTVIKDYIPFGYIGCEKFDTKDMKNTDFPYKYNIYIYNDNNEAKVGIRKWKDNDENKSIIKNIDEFKKSFEKELGNNKYKFLQVVSLFYTIMLKCKNFDLKQIINFRFSQLLSDEEWNELNKSKKLDNLCLKIANDLSSIELGRNISVGTGFKVFSLKKNTLTGPCQFYFYSEKK